MSKIKKIRKVLSVITAAALVSGGTGFTASVVSENTKASAAVAGDVNGDGSVNISDAVLLQKYLTKQGTLPKNASADINGDGKVNVFDLVSVKKYIVGASVSSENLIHLNGSTISIEGKNMTLSENNTVVTVTKGGTYTIDGTLSDGQIRVEAADSEDVVLVMSGADVTCSTGAPIYIASANSAAVTTVSGTANVLSDSADYSGTDKGTALYCAGNIVFGGSGSLTINCNNVAAGAAVTAEGTVTINDGAFSVTCSADANDEGADGVVSNTGDILVNSGTVKVNSKGGDAFKAKTGAVKVTGGTVTAKSEADSFQAGTSIDISGNAEVYAYGKRALTPGEGFKANIIGGSVVATSNEAFADTTGISVNSMVLGYTEKLDKAEITIKKNGTDLYSITPDKKYTYALIANDLLTDGTYNVFTGGVQMTHADAAKDGEFVKSGTVATYSSVAAISGEIVVPPVTEDNSIVLSDSGITATGTGMTLSADKKTVTISEPGTYSVTGEMTGGQIIVNADKTTYPLGVVELSLEGMSLTNTADSPIYVAAVGDECVISAKNGTVNTVSDGTSYTNADSDVGAIYSCDDLKLKGKGTLNVNGNCQDGIVSKNDVKIHNGNINVKAVDDGIRGKDSVKIGDADDVDFSNLKVTVETTGGDGIKSTEDTETDKGNITINGGTVKITSYADGIQAERDLTVNGGDIDIYTYQGSSFGGSASGGSWVDGNTNKTDISAKGLKAGDTDLSITGAITINGGTINVDSSDDCVHCNGNLNLYGGKLTLATADDGCHSDADLNIGDSTADDYSDVSVYVSKCYEGMEGMNINQVSGSVIVNSTDDGYNAAGGADGSGNTTPGGWGGGFPGGSSSSGNYSLNIKGGLALVNATDGDHDGFDSNGTLTVSGGIAISNGNETFDADGTKSYTGGVFVTNTGSSGGMGGGFPGGGFPGGGSSSSMTADISASTSASAGTRITLADGNNVIVSFIAKKNVTSLTAGCKSCTTAKFFTGGTVSGTPAAEGGDQIIYTSGTLSGGSQV